MYSPLNRCCISPNFRHTHWSMIVKLLRKQDWEDLLRASFLQSSKQKTISSLYFFVSTFGFHQCLRYDQVITMIYRGHVINKMADVYQKSFPMRLKKNKFIALLWASYCWYIYMCYRCLDREISLEQGKVYFKVIGQRFHELWKFETRHANSRNLCTFLIHFIPDPVSGLRVKPYF